jgi:hypothetical protein
MNEKPPGKVVPQNLTSEDILKEVKKTGEDAVRTALVWTLAGFLTKGARQFIEQLKKK